MKISDRVTNYISLLNNEPLPLPQSASLTGGRERSTTENTPDAVSLSSSALERADDEARRERLNTIRRQLAEGTYNISGKDVADKILNVLKG